MSKVSTPGNPETQRLWDEMLDAHIRRLSDKHRALVTGSEYHLTYSRVMDTVDRVSRETRMKKLPSCLAKLKPAFQHLHSFSEGISTMAQAQANPACLIWGGINILLTVALHYTTALETMLDMLGQLTSCITRLNRYVELLPNQPALLACLRHVCDAYIGFCVSAIIFYQKIRWYTIIKMVWKPIRERFQDSKANIEAHILRFEKEARVEIDEITVRGIQHLQKAHSTQPAKSAPASLFKVDYTRNKFFTGREKELSFLHDQLGRARAAGERGTCTIHSMGGVGKTQLALEYAYRYRADFNYVFWLPAEYGPRLAQVFADIATAVSAETSIGQGNSSTRSAPMPDSLAAGVSKSKEWLETTKSRWLLIYDNVDEWDTIQPYWPSGDAGSIVITSQRAHLVQVSGGCEIALPPLQAQDGGTLLLKHLRKLPTESSADFKDAVAIADTLGGLPVAISHVAGYIEKSQSRLSEFNQIYATREQSNRIWSQDCQTWTYQYQLTLETTWDIALQELPPESRALIDVLAMLDAEAVSEALLFSNPAINLSYDSIISLGGRQLVRRQWSSGKPFWSIHRALQQSLLHRLDSDPPARQKAFQRALDLTRQAFPRQSDIQAPSNQNWLANEACLAHALHLEDVYKKAPTPIHAPDHFVELLADVGNYMWEKGLYERGVLTLQLAKSIHNQPGRSHDLIEHSKVCSLLCGIFLELGISGRKEGLVEALECWELRQQYLGQLTSAEEMTQENCLLVANSWNDIACCMMEYGCYNKAEAWMAKSLEVKHKHKSGIPESGMAFFNFAENYKNLAIIRTSQNRHDEAVTLSRKAALLIEKHTDAENAVTLSFRFHLAYALYQAGSFQEALEVHEQVRQMRAQVFGPYNVHTLNSYYACAVVLQALDQAAEAEELLEYCLTVETNNTWTQDYVARIKHRLASLWTDRGHRPADAVTLIRDARAIRKHHAKFFRPFQVTDGPEGEEAVVYDHMIPIEGGRSTVGQLHVAASEIPEASVVVMSD